MKYKEFYKTYHEINDSLKREKKKWMDIIAKELKKFNKKFNNILDVGCYDGFLTIYLSKKLGIKNLYGIDISKKGIKLARKKGIKAYLRDISNQNLPFKRERFELVTMFDVIEHLFDPDYALEEIFRVLKKGGIFILTTPNLSYWLNRLTFLLGYKPYGMELSTQYIIGEPGGIKKVRPSGHIRVFPLKALLQLLRLHKFKILKVIGLSSFVRGKLKFISLFDKLFRKISPALSQEVIVISKK